VGRDLLLSTGKGNSEIIFKAVFPPQIKKTGAFIEETYTYS
jgi:hypothetical protein